jgi:hypothetical protein
VTIQCRSCGHTTLSDAAACGACGIRRPGRNMRPVFALWAVIVFLVIGGAVLWFAGMELSVQVGIGLVVAATAAALVRLLAPVIVRVPRPRPGSLVSQIARCESRVSQIQSQLAPLSDAFRTARKRKRTRLMADTLGRLKDSYLLLKQYHDKFDGQLQILNFSLWMKETAAIVSDWERGDLESISATYHHLIQRVDNCRVAFAPILSGRKSSEAYVQASATIRDGLRRVEKVGDAMVACKARLALAAVSPASLPPVEPSPVHLDEFVTADILNTSDELQREYDRIMAEHELGAPGVYANR